MFFFINFDGDAKAVAQDKGKLFEGLVADLINANGFKVIEMRAKTAGKEYDVIAKGKLDQKLLIGQAKAWDRSIAAKEVSEFSGSLDVEDFPEDALGLFVSLTDFTPEAMEHLNKMRKSKRERIKTIVGDHIIDSLTEAGYCSKGEIKRRSEQTFQHKAGDTHLLISSRGNYYIQLLVRSDETRPKAFCVLDTHGTVISEADFGRALKLRIEELKELKFLTQRGDYKSFLDIPPGPVGPGPEGASWFEYKLPAPPHYFVGRNNQIESFQSYLKDVQEGRTNVRVYQILSPSGVGKTSFLLKLQSLLKQPTCTAFVDSRNLRSSVDLLALLQEFLVNYASALEIAANVPADTASVLQEFSMVDQELQKRDLLGVFFIDQFESLFHKPELYTQFLDLVIRVIYDAKRVIFCIARRNDQPTTFDERIELDLQRLTGMSNSTELKDFSRVEVLNLLSHLSDEIGQTIKPKLQNIVLEFAASGYPWLCKRIGAHVWNALAKRSLTQNDFIQDGIRPEELFEEDLAGLVIMDKVFLKDVAKYLPATLDELSEKFDGNLLASKLKLFQDMRLVRLIGRTYDTYNDVFKEYLKTGMVPLPAKYIFRSAFSTTKKILVTIIEHNCQSVKALEQFSDITYGTMQNVLRELRMLELVDTSHRQLSVDQETYDAYQKGELDSLIKDRVRQRNGLVLDVLNRMATQEHITLNQLAEYLKEGLPVLEAADRSWHSYAQTFAGWLRFFGIRPGQIVNEQNKSVGAARLSLSTEDIFFPSVYISEIVRTLELFRLQPTLPRANINYQVMIDCKKIGLIHLDEKDKNVQITDLGQKFLNNDITRIHIIKDLLLSLTYVSNYLKLIENSSRKHVEVLKIALGDIGFTEETWIWRSKVLANWLEFANLVTRRSGRVHKSTQSFLF